jgi:hypothetical protein
VQKSTSESGVFLGKNAAVLAKSRGQREPHRHTIELAPRQWRGGHDSAVAETRCENWIYALAAAT